MTSKSKAPSEEHREKLRQLALEDNPMSKEEHRQTLSETQKDHDWSRAGSEHPNWQDAGPYEKGNLGLLGKMAVRAIRGYRCGRCGKRQHEQLQKLDVHHRNGDTTDNRLVNLEALCRACHTEVTFDDD